MALLSSLGAASALLLLLVLLPLCSLPRVSAQPPPPPPPPSGRQPSGVFHSWYPMAIAGSPSSPSLVYVVDSSSRVLLFNASEGPRARPMELPEVWNHSDFGAVNIAVDARSHVWLSGIWHPDLSTQSQPAVVHLDARLQLLQTISLASLKPPYLNDLQPQVVIDSKGWVYCFDGYAWSDQRGQMYVLDGQGEQMDAYVVNIPMLPYPNSTDYVMAIDSTDLLYFQQTSGSGLTYLLSAGNERVDVLDLFQRRRDSALELIADIAVDAAGTIYIASDSAAGVLRFGMDGRPLGPLPLLSRSGGSRSSRLAIAADGSVLCTDPVEQTVTVVSSDSGAALVVLQSDVAPMYSLHSLRFDPLSGDVLIAQFWADEVLATRISRRDGSLLQAYPLIPRPPPTQNYICRTESLAVGQSRRIYALISCGFFLGDTYALLRVVLPSGRLVSELHLPGFGFTPGAYLERWSAVEVDEENQRIFLAGESYISNRTNPYPEMRGRVIVLDMQGRWVANVTAPAGPRLGASLSLALAPAKGGRQLLILDSSNSRLMWADRDGVVQWVQALDRHDAYDDVVATDDGGYYLSYRDGPYYTAQSAVVRVDGKGREVERYIVEGQRWVGADLRRIAVSEDQLFAFSSFANSLIVWDRPRAPVSQEQR